MGDLESGASWLEGLRGLNEVIASTGEPLVGNLFYDHLQASYVDQPPNPVLRPKRDRFARAVAGRSDLLEVGVNGGHSAYLALSADPELTFHGVDICEHAYVRPAVEWLAGRFPGRVRFHEGDCREVLPRLRKERSTFDCFHVDGAKFTYYEDVRNCQRLATDGALVIVDDTHRPDVAGVWERCVREKRIETVEAFPSMSTDVKYRHEIGVLARASGWRIRR